MILDPLDIFIIREFFKKKVTTTWAMAKEYKWADCPSKECLEGVMEEKRKKAISKYYTSKCAIIEYRMKRLKKEGLITKEYNGEAKWVLDTDKVKIQKEKQPKIIKLPERYESCLLVKDKDNKWMVIQI